MSRGRSGRIVIEIDRKTKERLYVALAKENITLKDWFLKRCEIYLDTINQPSLIPFQEKENFNA